MKVIDGDIRTVITGTGPWAVAQGVNCQNAMGAGIAKVIYEVHPVVKEKYHQYCETRPSFSLLGDCHSVHIIENEQIVFNCFTQLDYGNDGKRYADPDMIKLSVGFAANVADQLGFKTLHVPLIGYGLGGLTLEEVISSLIEIEKDLLECEITLIIRLDDLKV